MNYLAVHLAMKRLAMNHLTMNYFAMNHLAMSYLAMNYLAMNFLAMNHLALNYLAMNHFAVLAAATDYSMLHHHDTNSASATATCFPAPRYQCDSLDVNKLPNQTDHFRCTPQANALRQMFQQIWK